MSKLDLSTLYAVGAGLVMAIAPLVSANAENRCDSEQGVGPDAKACAAAARSSTDLRRYVERTRGVYGLYYWDYAKPHKAAMAAIPAPTPSKIAASTAKLERTPSPAR